MQATTSRYLSTLGLTVTLGLAACGSSSEDKTATATNTNTTSTTATSTNTSTTTAGAANGFFEVQLMAAKSSTPGFTKIGGNVFNGPITTPPVMKKDSTEGACTLMVLANPFCSIPCGDGVCVARDTCEPTPQKQDVGTVTVAGIKDATGASPIELVSVLNSYQFAGSIPNPPAAEGAEVKLQATGAVYPAFSITGKMVAPLVVTNSKILLEGGKPFTLTWTPAGVAGNSKIHVEVDLSHHGGTKGRLLCDGDDTGSLVMPAAILKKLIDLGVTGFPTIYVTRSNVNSTTVGQGKIDLKIYDLVPLVAEMPGLISCNDDSQCPTGQTCQNPGLFCK